jgi:predicted RND superfamily exporter protein
MNLNEDKAEFYTIPETKEKASQFKLLYELSLPYGLNLNDRLSIDTSSSRVTVTMQDISMVGVRSFVRDANSWMEQNLPTHTTGYASGVAVMFSQISKRNIEGMLVGNTYGLLVISAMLLLMLKSLRMGAISLITNIAPIAMSFGIWAILIGEIGMAAATVAAVSLGIIVDDTVHFLTKYIRSLRSGLSTIESIKVTAMTVGKAVIIITLITISGFIVLSISSFRVNVQMGALTAITLTIGAMFNVYVLPALLSLGQNDIRIKNNA